VFHICDLRYGACDSFETKEIDNYQSLKCYQVYTFAIWNIRYKW